jgi:hypothetical protein
MGNWATIENESDEGSFGSLCKVGWICFREETMSWAMGYYCHDACVQAVHQ